MSEMGGRGVGWAGEEGAQRRRERKAWIVAFVGPCGIPMGQSHPLSTS